MILFLQRDAKQRYPSGFENPQLNFFDPEEDHVRLACLQDKASKVPLKGLQMEEDGSSSDSDSSVTSSDAIPPPDPATTGNTDIASSETCQPLVGRSKANAPKRKKKVSKYCIREGCKRKPRFDSSFCSDACGASTMESDLLRSLSFANNMHPYNLRN